MNQKDIDALIKFYEIESDNDKEPYSFIDIASHIENITRTFETHVDSENTIDKKIGVLRYLYKFPLSHFIYKSFKNYDMKQLHDTLYHFATWNQIREVNGGRVPGGQFHNDVIYLLAGCKKDNINNAIPKEWGLCDKGNLVGTTFTNLFMAIWYDKEDFKENVKIKADKFLSTKQAIKDVATVKYLLAILDKDAKSASEHLDAVCKGASVSKDFGATKFNKAFSIETHGLYNLSHLAYGGELAGKVDMPNQKNFCEELANYQKSIGFGIGELVIVYDEPFTLLNNIFKAVPPKMVRAQPYIDGQPWNVIPSLNPSKEEIEERYGKDYRIKKKKDYCINNVEYNANAIKQIMLTL